MAFGALIIKEELGLSDEYTFLMISINPHCQYFLGMNEFINHLPFDSNKMVAFRKRFPAVAMVEINEAIISQNRNDQTPTATAGGNENNKGET